MNTTTLAADLRRLACIIDENPDLNLRPSGRLTVYVGWTDRTFSDTVRALARHGLVTKDHDIFYKVSLPVGDHAEIVALDHANETACELVQTGVRTVERPVMVGVETVTEAILEWKCPDSILASS